MVTADLCPSAPCLSDTPWAPLVPLGAVGGPGQPLLPAPTAQAFHPGHRETLGGEGLCPARRTRGPARPPPGGQEEDEVTFPLRSGTWGCRERQAPAQVTECGEWMQAAGPGSPGALVLAGLGEPAGRLDRSREGRRASFPGGGGQCRRLRPVGTHLADRRCRSLGPRLMLSRGFPPRFCWASDWGTVPGSPRQTLLPPRCPGGPPGGGRWVGKSRGP